VEDEPQGYPRFTALISSHQSFQIYRRFCALRTRLLLYDQDRLARLEDQLQRIDENEEEPLYLGSYRHDTNAERKAVVQEIKEALREYDSLLEGQRRVLAFGAVQARALSNLRNWVGGQGCIAPCETAYLTYLKYEGDLLRVTDPMDDATSWAEALVEDTRIFLRSCIGSLNVSRDPYVHIFPSTSMARTIKMLLTAFVAILLLSPIVICNAINSITGRLVVVVFATTGFIAAVAGLTNSRTIELMVAGATYVQSKLMIPGDK
ncbi:hypothetical protein B0I35DRAFT_350816, partial [Stachybotrys elegans]